MTSKVILPFNHQPKASVDQTSSLTIASGEYARVRPLSPSCTINSERVWDTGISSVMTLASSSHYLAIPDNFTGRITSSSSAVIKYLNYQDSDTTLLAGSTALNIAGSGSAVSLPVIGGHPLGYSFTSQSTTVYRGGRFCFTLSSSVSTAFTFYHGTDPGWIWVKSGDVLAGANFLVERYNELT